MRATVAARDPFTRRAMKIALFATAMFWLAVWLVIGWRIGVQFLALAAFALAIVVYGALGVLSFRDRRMRFIGAWGALALTLIIAFVTFLDTRLLAGGLAVAAASAIDPDRMA